jgi:hypothetical protein
MLCHAPQAELFDVCAPLGISLGRVLLLALSSALVSAGSRFSSSSKGEAVSTGAASRLCGVMVLSPGDLGHHGLLAVAAAIPSPADSRDPSSARSSTAAPTEN